MVDVDVALRAWVARGLVGGDQGQALEPGVQPVATEDFPDAVGRDDDATPLVAPQLGRHPLGPETGVRDREGEDPLLEPSQTEAAIPLTGRGAHHWLPSDGKSVVAPIGQTMEVVGRASV